MALCQCQWFFFLLDHLSLFISYSSPITMLSIPFPTSLHESSSCWPFTAVLACSALGPLQSLIKDVLTTSPLSVHSQPPLPWHGHCHSVSDLFQAWSALFQAWSAQEIKPFLTTLSCLLHLPTTYLSSMVTWCYLGQFSSSASMINFGTLTMLQSWNVCLYYFNSIWKWTSWFVWQC